MADLGVCHMMLVLQEKECKSYRVMDTSAQISKEALGSQTICVGLRSLQVSTERAMHEAVKVKLKTQWRPQKVRDVKSVECLPMKAVGSKPT